VERYIDSYDMYQRIKNQTKVPEEKLMVNNIPEKSWIHFMVDFITKLLLVAGKNMILVVYNILSKIAHFMVITEGISVEGLARLFRDNIWKLHGLYQS